MPVSQDFSLIFVSVALAFLLRMPMPLIAGSTHIENRDEPSATNTRLFKVILF